MAFGSFDAESSDPPMAEINMVPLIDVMLVLLLVFMITAPLMTHAIPVQLPRASHEPPPEAPKRVAVSIDGKGQLFVDAQAVDRTQLQERLRASALQTPQPVLNLSADRETPYETVAQVLGDAARAGLSRIGFITDPVGDPGVAPRQ
jgi:biopolymer transport protein ExbD